MGSRSVELITSVRSSPRHRERGVLSLLGEEKLLKAAGVVLPFGPWNSTGPSNRSTKATPTLFLQEHHERPSNFHSTTNTPFFMWVPVNSTGGCPSRDGGSEGGGEVETATTIWRDQSIFWIPRTASRLLALSLLGALNFSTSTADLRTNWVSGSKPPREPLPLLAPALARITGAFWSAAPAGVPQGAAIQPRSIAPVANAVDIFPKDQSERAIACLPFA